MNIKVKCKPGQTVYYLDELNNKLIPCLCIKVIVVEREIEYYFDKLPYTFYDYHFNNEIFTDYEIACKQLKQRGN